MKSWIAMICVLLIGAGIASGANSQTSGEDCVDIREAEHAGWAGIETAPKDKPILLGLLTETGFVQGVGHWDVRDELGAGLWTVEEWWGRSPSHWAPIPPAPSEAN